ncbi:hypothetical protein ACOMHN_028230 [Nucella lapillus]
MLQSLYLLALLLMAVIAQNGDFDPDPDSDLDPKVNNIVPLPLSSSPGQPPPLPSPSPQPTPQSTTTTTTKTTPVPSTQSGSEILTNGGPSSKGEHPPGLVVSHGSIGPSPHSPARSCSFTVGNADDFQPDSEGFGYPGAIVEQILKGTVAEKALQALQKAKLRTAYGFTTTNNNNNNINYNLDNINTNFGNNNNIGNNNNNPFLSGVDTGNSLNINRDSSSLNSLPSALNRNPIPSLKGINTLSLTSPLGTRLPLQSSSPSQAASRMSQNIGDSGTSIDNFLSNLDPGNSNTNSGSVFRVISPAGQNRQQLEQKIHQMFPNGGNPNSFPQESFFLPDRFDSRQTNRAASSPFSLSGLQNSDPLTAVRTGSGNDVIYDVTGRGNQQPTPFDGFNPFPAQNQFTVRRRNKRQIKARGQVRDVCGSTPQLLRKYRHYGGACHVIRPLLQQVTFVTCSNSACSQCLYPGGSTHCLADTRGVALWAYCDSGPLQQTVGLDFIHLPVVCSCKTIPCS